MKIQFKHQAYQAEAVADCFAGQPKVKGIAWISAMNSVPHEPLIPSSFQRRSPTTSPATWKFCARKKPARHGCCGNW
jgi:hypothetical protein